MPSGKTKNHENELDALPEGAWRDSEVNSFVDFDNNYLASVQGNTHYYYTNNKLYREDITGEHEIETAEVYGCRNICPAGDYVYFINESPASSGPYKNGRIVKYNVHTKEISQYEGTLGAYEGYKNLAYKDGYIYYMIISYNNEQIARANPENGEVEVLVKDRNITHYCIEGDKIYYHFYARNSSDERISEIYSMNLDGSDNKKILELKELLYMTSFMPYTKDGKTYIYLYSTHAPGERAAFTIYDVDSDSSVLVYEDEVDTTETEGKLPLPDMTLNGDLCFSYGNGIGVLKQTTDNSWLTQKVMPAEQKEDWCVIGDYLYFTTEKEEATSTHEILHRTLPDGTTQTITEDK